MWAALDETLGRHVAVKALTGYPAQGGHEHERLRREARLLATLAHPRITSVFDYLEQPSTDGACQPILVTELIDGIDLSTRLHEGPMPAEEALTVCAQVADALAAAHEAGIVHRDVKPGNVMLTENGAMLLDFGIARTSSDTDLTGTNVIGTPACMAPEQWLGRGAQPASDVYALGCLLYWCLSGQRPYPQTDLAALGLAHLQADAPPLPLAGLDPQLSELYDACVAKDPAQRPSARAVSGLLAEHLLPVAEPAYPDPSPPRSRRRFVPLVATGTLLAAALAIPLALTSGAENNSGAVVGSSASPSLPPQNHGAVTASANAATPARFNVPSGSGYPSPPASPLPQPGRTTSAGASHPPTPPGPAGSSPSTPPGPTGQPSPPEPPTPSAPLSPPASPSPAGQAPSQQAAQTPTI